MQEVICTILLAVEYWIIMELCARHMFRDVTYLAFLSVALIRLVPHAFLLPKVLVYLGTNQRAFLHLPLPFPHVGHVPKLSKLLLLGLEKRTIAWIDPNSCLHTENLCVKSK